MRLTTSFHARSQGEKVPITDRGWKSPKWCSLVTNEDNPSHGEDWQEGVVLGSFHSTLPPCHGHTKWPLSAQTSQSQLPRLRSSGLSACYRALSLHFPAGDVNVTMLQVNKGRPKGGSDLSFTQEDGGGVGLQFQSPDTLILLPRCKPAIHHHLFTSQGLVAGGGGGASPASPGLSFSGSGIQCLVQMNDYKFFVVFMRQHFMQYRLTLNF